MLVVEAPKSPPVPEAVCGWEDNRPAKGFELDWGFDWEDSKPAKGLELDWGFGAPPRLLKRLGCCCVWKVLTLLNCPSVYGCGVDVDPLPRLLKRLVFGGSVLEDILEVS